MKIDVNHTQLLNIKKNETQNEAKPQGQEILAEPVSSAKLNTVDTVNLSDRSKLIAKARELAFSAPDIRSEKVADLTAKVAAGTYKVSSSDVADSIIRKSISEIV